MLFRSGRSEERSGGAVEDGAAVEGTAVSEGSMAVAVEVEGTSWVLTSCDSTVVSGDCTRAASPGSAADLSSNGD